MGRTDSKMRLVLLLVASVVVVGVALSAGQAESAFPGRNGKIAFNTNNGIYTVKANGRGRKRLRGAGFEPAWSPNGKQIAFVREDSEGGGEIWKMNERGRGLKRLTNSKHAYDQHPTWSPGGTKIAFTRMPDSDQEEDDSEIYVMRANGSKKRALTDNVREDYHPAWSPKGAGRGKLRGKLIAFTQQRVTGMQDIKVMSARSGRIIRLLTRTEGRDEFNPTWSPSGKKVAFAAVEDFDSQMFKVNARGGGETPLTDPSSTFGGDEPAWSPNGKRIVYRLFSELGWLGLDLIRANGRGLPWGYRAFGDVDQNPDWQPLKKRRRKW